MVKLRECNDKKCSGNTALGFVSDEVLLGVRNQGIGIF